MNVRTLLWGFLRGGPGERQLSEAVSGRVVLVTGASHGIGKRTARRLGAAGATVLLVARTEQKLEDLRAEIADLGGTAHVHPADLSDIASVEALATEILERYGHVDVLVSNAGKSIRRSIDLSYDRFHDFTRTIDVNYLGPVRLILALLPVMRERGSGHIVNVSTLGVQMPPAPRWAAYQASKSAFDVWLRSVAPEVRSDGVDVSTVYMVLVHTRMSARTSLYRRMPGLRADDAAELVCRAIVDRPSSVAPWWSLPVSLAYQTARSPFETAFRLYYRATEDSNPARGESAPRDGNSRP